MTTWTAYVCYPFDPAALALDNDGLLQVAKSGDASVEEIDVEALTYADAWEAAKKELAENYQTGGRIVHLEERIGCW